MVRYHACKPTQGFQSMHSNIRFISTGLPHTIFPLAPGGCSMHSRCPSRQIIRSAFSFPSCSLHHNRRNYGEHGVSLDPRSSPLSPQPAENAVSVSKSLLLMQQNCRSNLVSTNIHAWDNWRIMSLTPGEARTLPLALSQKLLLAATFPSRSLQKNVSNSPCLFHEVRTSVNVPIFGQCEHNRWLNSIFPGKWSLLTQRQY